MSSFLPLHAATKWADSQKATQLHCALALCAIEDALATNQANNAAVILKQIRQKIGRRDMLSGRLGAEIHLASARIAMSGGREDLARQLPAVILFEKRNCLQTRYRAPPSDEFLRKPGHSSLW